MLFFVKRFSFKVKEQEKSARKVYVADIGLSNSIGFKFRSNKREVDFVVKKGQKVKQLVQVCWNIEEYKTKEREINAMLKAGKELKCKNLLVITEDKEEEEKIQNKKIKYMPLWKYLLSDF